jgi:hypothetical protein
MSGRRRQMSILPPGMDGRSYNGTYGKDGALQDWQRNAADTLARSLERTQAQRTHSGMQDTIRPVTPEDEEDSVIRDGLSSVQTSPRSILGGAKPQDRRQGLVFQDSYSSESIETGTRSGPPVSFHSHPRPRTRTLEEPSRQRSTTSNSVSKSRYRIGSVHSTNSSLFHDVDPPRHLPDTSNSLGFPSVTTKPSPQLQKSNSVKGGRRLVKQGSRPTSPLQGADIPSVDSLPFPVATGDANKILMLMKTLCGRMRGEVEYQAVDQGAWYSGICYIDDVKGALMYEGDDHGPFHVTVVPDLRGCRVRPLNSTERPVKCLELSHAAQGIELRLIPLVNTEFDLWLSALLCWQQIRSSTLPSSPPNSATTAERQPGTNRRESGFNQLKESGGSKDANIIKVAKLLLWDKGAPTSPSAIVRRPSTRDLRPSSPRSWRRVSCILQDNGELKLFTENDVTLLSVIQLSQLSRCAIQRLDKSVLDEEYSIAIFPQYTSTSTQLSIFRPVYIALESRLTYEVWFCLLKAFSIPEIYGPQNAENSDEYDDSGVLLENTPTTNDMFRIEKTLNMRVVEAKIRRPAAPKSDAVQSGRHSVKMEQQDPSIGDYFAEVILDSEVRARTITKFDTRNPFWREDCEFLDLPTYLPRLSVVLKKIEHGEPATHGSQSSSSVHVPDSHQTEVACGTVNVPIEKLQHSKDSEAWWSILDEKQEPIGEMFLKIRHEELVVLLARDYQPISELLHRFNAGLTVQIAQAIPTRLRHLSEILLNIFQVSGHAGEWLKTLAEDEIDGIGKETPVHRLPRWSRRVGSNESLSSFDREFSVRDMGKSLQGEANLLFRGNSLLTQALDFHMRRLGKEFLEEVLSEKILEINALNPDCEVDPSRLGHGEDVSKNWTQLTALTKTVWESIAESAHRCPPELRQILKYIRAVAEDRYGDFLRTVAYTSVSGFLFLRFFCPALLNPKLFGLLRDHPQPKAQRTLTLIAKSLQALANLSTFGQKEEWMEPMNRFLASHRQAVKDYIDAICAIPSERNTFALPASYSTPITILARLPPTSREGFPSLPYLIDHARNFAALVKLWLEAAEHLMSSQVLEGDLKQFNQYCVELQCRTDECLMKAEGDRTADQMSLQWEDIVESLESSTIHDVANPNPEPEVHTPAWTEYTASITGGQRVASGSSGSEVGSKERKERQSFWEATFGKDSKYQRPYQYDAADDSPPSRGQSRNGKQARSFLTGLRRKGKADTPGPGSLERDGGIGPSPGSSWNGGNGNMI